MKRTRSSGPADAGPGTRCGRFVWGKPGVQNNRSRGARELTERLKIESLNFGAIVAPLSNPFFAPLRRSTTFRHLDSRRAAISRGAAQGSENTLELDAGGRVGCAHVASGKRAALDKAAEG